MSEELLLTLAKQSLQTLLWISAPMLVTGILVGVTISLLQVVTSIQDATLAFVPRARSLMVGGFTTAVSPASRFLSRTGTLSCRSLGAWMMSTDTDTLLTLLSLTPCSATPTGTTDRIGAVAPPTHTGSVITSLTWRSALSGPTTSTIFGCEVESPTM